MLDQRVAPAPPPLTVRQEAVQQAEADGLTLRTGCSTGGYQGVTFDRS